MRTMTILLLATLAALPACGKKVLLRPAEGQPMPQKSATAAIQPNVNMLLDPGAQARPARSSELISKSQTLAPDRFDLPPPG